MTVVTISRQSGTGSREIATEVAKLLGYRHFDKWSIVKVTAEMGLSENEVVDFSEEDYQVSGFLDHLLGRHPQVGLKIPIRTRDGAGAESLTVEQLDEAVCLDLIQAAIQAAYRQGNVVILGRGSQAILQGKPHSFHVRIVAPLEDRVRRIMGQHEELTRTEAQNWAIRQDRKTAEYLKHFFGIYWEDPTLYHLVINVGKLEPWQAAKIIADTVAVGQLNRVSMNLL
jgi:cytidylate kinase